MSASAFDYFALLDQSGGLWYWWINAAGELAWSLSPPSLAGWQAVALALLPTPSWLVLGAWYLYPSSTLGEPLSSTTAPALGTGYSGTLVLRSPAALGLWTLTTSPAGDVSPVVGLTLTMAQAVYATAETLRAPLTATLEVLHAVLMADEEALMAGLSAREEQVAAGLLGDEEALVALVVVGEEEVL